MSPITLDLDDFYDYDYNYDYDYISASGKFIKEKCYRSNKQMRI